MNHFDLPASVTDWIDFRDGIELLSRLLVPPLGSAVVQEAYTRSAQAPLRQQGLPFREHGKRN